MKLRLPRLRASLRVALARERIHSRLTTEVWLATMYPTLSTAADLRRIQRWHERNLRRVNRLVERN